MKKLLSALAMLMLPVSLMASEADLKMPEGFADNASVLYWGFLIVILGLLFGLWQFSRVKKLKAHSSMLEIGNVIFKTCSTYLKQQGKFLGILFLFIGAAIASAKQATFSEAAEGAPDVYGTITYQFTNK